MSRRKQDLAITEGQGERIPAAVLQAQALVCTSGPWNQQRKSTFYSNRGTGRNDPRLKTSHLENSLATAGRVHIKLGLGLSITLRLQAGIENMTKTKQLEYQPVKMPGANGDLSRSDDSIKKLDASLEEAEGPCGWGSVQPPSLQRLRNAKCVLFWLCCAGAIQVSCLLLKFKLCPAFVHICLPFLTFFYFGMRWSLWCVGYIFKPLEILFTSVPNFDLKCEWIKTLL